VISNLIEAGAKGGVPDGIRVLVAGANTASLDVLRETLASGRMEIVAEDWNWRGACAGRPQAALPLLP
jgi:hypothetical protein